MAFVASGAAVQNHGDGMSRARPLKVGILTTDNRFHFKEYHQPEPSFGTAVAALLQGLAQFPSEIEGHVISATQEPLASPARLASNIYYHSLLVPKLGWLRTAYQGCIRAVRVKVRKLGLDLVHGQGTERDCAIEAVFSGRPNLLTLHGNMRAVARALHAPLFSYHGFHSFLESFALRRTGMVFCNSSYTESLVRPLNSRVVSMPNPVREIFFSPLPSTTRPPDRELRLLMVGLVCSYKQPLEVLRTLRRWREQGAPRFQCRWVGALSGETEYVRSFVAELEAAKNAGWADHVTSVDERELRDLMDASDVLVHVPKEEAFGLVVAEAMVRGLRVVGARTGGIPDFAKLYPGIVLVDPHEPTEWRQGLEAALRMGSTPIARENWNFLKFHPREVAQQHIRYYLEGWLPRGSPSSTLASR